MCNDTQTRKNFNIVPSPGLGILLKKCNIYGDLDFDLQVVSPGPIHEAYAMA